MTEGALSADEARQRLYEIMKRDAGFEEKAREALELGRQYLAVQSGFVSKVEQQTNHYEVLISTGGADGVVPEGMTTDLRGTYCRHTLERDSPLAFHDVEQQEEIENLERGNFDCYHGTTLTVDTEPFGTVCFVSLDARGERFTEAETMFAELVARLLEHELEHDRQQAELSRQTSLINVLDRVLRHNLRNEMTIIRANAQLGWEGGCTECELIVERSDNLIEMSEAARDLGKLINTDFDRQQMQVEELVGRLETRVTESYPDVQLVVDTPDSLVLSAYPSLESALWELLENAGEYAGPNPSVTLSVRPQPDAVTIAISDDGPGMPQPERDALQAGTETQLIHGSGIGLWTAYWVAASHGGDLDIETDDGTTVRLSLPRASSGSEIDSTEPLLSRAPDRYQAAFTNAQIPLLLLDESGRIIDANEQAETLFGQTRSSLLGRNGTELFAEVERSELFADATSSRQVETDTAETPTVRWQVSNDIIPGQHLMQLQPVRTRQTNPSRYS